MIIKLNLNQIRRELAAMKGRDYTWEEIGDAAKIHYNTLYSMAANKPTRIDLPVLARLMVYFRREGHAITFNDLMTLEEGDYPEPKPRKSKRSTP
jgi:hypothetical protein